MKRQEEELRKALGYLLIEVQRYAGPFDEKALRWYNEAVQIWNDATATPEMEQLVEWLDWLEAENKKVLAEQGDDQTRRNYWLHRLQIITVIKKHIREEHGYGEQP